MLHGRFPNLLRIVKGKIGEDGTVSGKDLGDAVSWADFLLHSSGASLVARDDIDGFVKLTGKPFGVLAITYGSRFSKPSEKAILDQARFVYFRDSVSLEKAKGDGVRSPIMDFCPDVAFAVDVRDDPGAEAFLAKHGLETGKFLTLITKWRYTPYWQIRDKGEPKTEVDKQQWARNEEMKESDNAKLREAAVAFVRQTGMKVLVCPEDMSHMEIGKQLIVDKLPDDVRAKTVWQENFWPLEEAVAVHARAFALLSLDMHSPVMILKQGTPAIVCRFEEQTSKGIMWRDIGLGEWLFDFDTEVDGANVTDALLGIAADPAAARAKAEKAMAFVDQRQQEALSVLANTLPR